MKLATDRAKVRGALVGAFGVSLSALIGFAVFDRGIAAGTDVQSHVRLAQPQRSFVETSIASLQTQRQEPQERKGNDRGDEKVIVLPDEAAAGARTIRRPPETATPELKGVLLKLKSPDPNRRIAACRALASFQPTHPRTAADALADVVIGDKDYNVRFEALSRLYGFITDGDKVAPFLIKTLKEPRIDEPVRINMCVALGVAGLYELDSASDVLADQLNSNKVSVRAKYVSAVALGQIGADSDKALDALLKNVDSKASFQDEGSNNKVCVLGEACFEALAKIRRPYVKAVPVFIERLSSSRAEQRRYAAMGLRAMGPASAEAVPALLELLNDNDPALQALSASTLGEIGPAASKAIPKLQELFQAETNPINRGHLLLAIAKVGRDTPDEVVPFLRKYILDPDETVSDAAISAVAEIGPAARHAITEIQGLPKNRRGNHLVSSSAIGGRARVPGLVKRLSSDKFDERSIVCEALKKLGPAAKEAIPALIELAKKDFTPAIEALGPVGREEAVPTLVELMDRDDIVVADAAIRSLMYTGPAAKAVLPKLQEIARNRELKTPLRGAALVAINAVTYQTKSR